MAFSSLRNRAFARSGFRFACGGPVCCGRPLGLAAPDGPMAEKIAVNVDQAKLVKLPGKVATIVVGNPMIADVTLQAGGIVVVTGKGYGATNFIALDRAGEVVVDRVIQVEGPSDQLVTVYRGVEREVLQLHADLPAPGHPWRRRRLLQGDDGPGRLPQQHGHRYGGRRPARRRTDPSPVASRHAARIALHDRGDGLVNAALTERARLS